MAFGILNSLLMIGSALGTDFGHIRLWVIDYYTFLREETCGFRMILFFYFCWTMSWKYPEILLFSVFEF